MTDHTNHNPNDSAASHDNVRGEEEPDGRAGRNRDFAQRAGQFAKNLPGLIDDQLRQHPYRALAVVGLAATAAGVVLSSRVLRAVLTTAMTAVALDVGRALLGQARSQIRGNGIH